ncbi:hypothetical protein L1049_005350 [Liquidambar formosana]|uniref:O-fucosyltransferase family protein n=1 Tax=Liquidambar formosana TaxID=63359 RepID=A0AAP0RR29_LIQFO
MEAMEKVKLKQGLKIGMSISSEGNAYLQDSQFWKLYKEDQASCSIVMRTSVGLVYLLACLLEPFMPSFSLEVLKQLNLPSETHFSLCDENGDLERVRKPWEILPAGHKIGTPYPLFKELKDEDVEFFRVKFAGSQADRVLKAEAEAKKLSEQLNKMEISDGSGKKPQPTKSASVVKMKTSSESEVSISRLDIRVGQIKEVQRHPGADSLYVEEIDVGEGSTRTVVSGLVKYIPLEEMKDRKVCVLCNLKPATMRGIKSQAMVLAASSSDHTNVELINPPHSAQVGERVAFPGFEGQPDNVLNPKKKVWETVQLDLHTNSELVACYKGAQTPTVKAQFCGRFGERVVPDSSCWGSLQWRGLDLDREDERGRGAEALGRRYGHKQQLKQLGWGMKGLFGRLSVAVVVLLICTVSYFFTFKGNHGSIDKLEMNAEELWSTAASGGWRPSSAPRSDWPPPPIESNGYLRVRCNGGLNQQRTAICNAVLAARIMNATLVLPELDANSFWHDDSGFHGIYDVRHFIKSLRYDVRIVEKLPETHKNGKTKKMKTHQLRPPRDAPISWYTTVALEKMKEHGAIYLTPFSHRLAEEIDNPEYQRLRCRVNYHALRFKPHIMKLSHSIVNKLRAQGHFMAIHLRFEMDMLAFAGCFDIFTPQEQRILKKYREENFAAKELVYSERRAIGKCPLTPEEVGLVLRAMGFDNSTRIYLAAGELFGGKRFMKPFKALFPHLENRNTVGPAEELAENTRGLLGSAVDYMVCLLSDIFMPTYDGPSNFANNLMGHRLYYGFRTTIQPDRKALAPIFIDRENGQTSGFEEAIRRVMFKSKFGGPHERVHPESFYTNSWPECFCQTSPTDPANKCPPENVMEILNSRLQSDETDMLDPVSRSNLTDSMS